MALFIECLAVSVKWLCWVIWKISPYVFIGGVIAFVLGWIK